MLYPSADGDTRGLGAAATLSASTSVGVPLTIQRPTAVMTSRPLKITISVKLMRCAPFSPWYQARVRATNKPITISTNTDC